MHSIPQPQPIDAPESDYLYVQASGIPGAGMGLFTAIPIHRGEVIARYKGEQLIAAEAKDRAARGEDDYFVMLLNGGTLDGMHADCFAKYANDVEGPGHTHLRNNAVITLDDEDSPCVVATRSIKAGEEVFVGYGSAYWEARLN